MSKRQPDLSWDVAVDEKNWLQLTVSQDRKVQGENAGLSTRMRSLANRRLIGVALLAAVLVLTAGYSYIHASTGLAQVSSELETAAQIERWAASPGSTIAISDRLDPDAPELWHTRMNLTYEGMGPLAHDGARPTSVAPMLFRGDVALVEVYDYTTNGTAYVSNRFYRESGEGWLRTTPRPELWGSPRTRESRYFVFYFRARDTELIDAVAATIDDAYTALRADLALPPADGLDKLTVQVAVSSAADFDMLDLHFEGDRLEIPSPLLLSVRQGIAPEQVLHLGIYQALARKLYSESTRQYPIRRPWHLLRQSLLSWQVSQTAGSEQRRMEALRQLYNVSSEVQGDTQAGHTQDLAWICEITGPDMYLLTQFSLGDDCNNESPVHPIARIGAPPYSLQQFDMEPSFTGTREHWLQAWQRDAILASIIGYGVDTYGRSSLSRLVRATNTYDSWSTLIPAVYGVSMQEFETGWQAYLTR